MMVATTCLASVQFTTSSPKKPVKVEYPLDVIYQSLDCVLEAPPPSPAAPAAAACSASPPPPSPPWPPGPCSPPLVSAPSPSSSRPAAGSTWPGPRWSTWCWPRGSHCSLVTSSSWLLDVPFGLSKCIFRCSFSSVWLTPEYFPRFQSFSLQSHSTSSCWSSSQSLGLDPTGTSWPCPNPGYWTSWPFPILHRPVSPLRCWDELTHYHPISHNSPSSVCWDELTSANPPLPRPSCLLGPVEQC